MFDEAVLIHDIRFSYRMSRYCLYLLTIGRNLKRIYYVIVITWARVPHGRYWHSSDVKPEGRRPEGFTSLLCQYLPCGRREARVITSLLHDMTM